MPELRGLLEAIVKDDATVEGHEVDREFPRVGRRIVRLSARKLFYEEGTHNTTLLAFEDITHRRAIGRRFKSCCAKRTCFWRRCSTGLPTACKSSPAFFS